MATRLLSLSQKCTVRRLRVRRNPSLLNCFGLLIVILCVTKAAAYSPTSITWNPPGDVYGEGGTAGVSIPSPYQQNGFTLTYNGYAEENSHTLAFGSHWTGRVGVDYQKLDQGPDNTSISFARTDGSEFWLNEFNIDIDASGAKTLFFQGFKDGEAVTELVTVANLTGGSNNILFADPAFANIDEFRITAGSAIRGLMRETKFHPAALGGTYGNVLSPGDIAILAVSIVNNDFSFIVLADLPGDHYIFFTTAGWDSGDSSWLGGSPALVTADWLAHGMFWKTPPEGVTKGSIINYKNAAGEISTEWPSFAYDETTFLLQDQLLVFEKADATATTPHFIYAANFHDAAEDTTGFQTSFGSDTARITGVPTGLTAAASGETGSAFGLAPGNALDVALKTGVLSNGMTRDEVLQAVHTPGNWEVYSDTDEYAGFSLSGRYGSSITITGGSDPIPTITSATYDANGGALTVTGTDLSAADGATNDIVANKFTFTGEGGSTYTLTDTANVELTSGTGFTLTLSATDRAGVNRLLNKNGTSSTGGTTYNVAAAEDWAAGADPALTIADTTGNGITVSNVAVPAITSATYDADGGALTVTGTGFLSASGATNDIVANKFTFTGEGGSTYTLTDTANVELTSGTGFTLTLSATDRAGVNQLLNKNGTSSSGGTTYNVAAAEDWAAGADAAVVVADTTGNGITVSNVAVPALTSATYDASTGSLAVTGTGFLSLNGATNDIVANKFTVTGEGGATYTLTDTANVEIASNTSFTLSLSATDKAGVNQLLNKNGTSSTGGTTYNVAAAEDWAAGADAAVVVADTTGNGITVSNVAVPALTSATYDASIGALAVTGTDFLPSSGATNDVVANKFTLTGEGGATYTLTDTANVEITSGTSFTLALSATDRAGVNQLLNKNGTSSTDGTTYNVAAAEDWAAGADAAVVVADTTGNGITASNVDSTSPAVTSVGVPADATYISSQHLDFTVTFDENVTVNTGGGTPRIALTLATGGTVYASYSSGSGTKTLTFRYIVVAGNLDADGIAVTSSIDLNGGSLEDATGNEAQTTGLGFAGTAGVLVDAVLPAVSSIERADANPTKATSVDYTVTFLKDVTGVDTNDFTVTATGTAAGTIASVTPVDGHTFTVTVNTVSGDGTLRLDLNNAGTGISDTPGNAITTGFTSGETYTIDNNTPTLETSLRQAPVTVNSDASSLTWRVTFDADVSGVDAADFAVTALGGSTAAGTVASVTPVDASTYDVVVNALSGQGQVRLDLDATGTGIADLAGNALADGGFTTGDFYIAGVASVFETLALPNEFIHAANLTNQPAQRFTTSATGPLTLTTVTASIASITGTPAPVVTVNADNAGSPGTVVATLVNPTTLTANALNVWTGSTPLDPNTVYWIVFGQTNAGADYSLNISTTTTGGSGGWLTDTHPAADSDYLLRHGAGSSLSMYGAIRMAIGATSTPAITSSLTANGDYGTALAYSITATNTPTSYAATGLPAGLTLNASTGAITGTPEAAGTFNVVLTATNGSGASAPSTLVLTIAKVALTVTAGDATRAYGEANPSFSIGYTGFVGGDTATDLTTAPSATTTATAGSAPGTYTITPAGAASSNYTFTYVDGSLTVEQATQSINFPSIGGVQPGATVNLVATSTSGLPVTFSLVSGDATLVGSTLTIDGGGSVVVQASQAGDTNYLSAPSVNRTITADKLEQTITFASLPNRRADDAAFTLTASASSGLPVGFAIVSGPAILEGNTLTLTGIPGTVVVTASQVGDDTYEAANPVSQSFAVDAVGPLVFFGSLGSESIAASLNPDGRSGTMIGIIPGLGEGFVINFSVNLDGTWSATVTTYTAGSSSPSNAVRGLSALTSTSRKSKTLPGPGIAGLATFSRTFHGTVQGGVLSGTIEGLDLDFTANLQPPTGETAGMAGYYEAPSINSATGATYSVVGTEGKVYVLVITASAVAGSAGEVSADGSFSLETAQQVTIVGNVDAPSTSVTGTILLPNGEEEDFSGVRDSTLRSDRLINLSTRARFTGNGTGTLITGFVIGGAAPKQVLLRGVGPTLAEFNVGDPLSDPRLRVFNAAGEVIAENDNWIGSTELTAVMQRVGAFALPASSRDAALLMTLDPGAYTVHVLDGGESGIALAEIYDASANPQTEYQRLINISSRGTVSGGEGVLIGGFIVTGNAPKRVLVRGSGPALVAHGVTGTLTDPQLLVLNGESAIVARNDNWEAPLTVDAVQSSATAAEITAANAVTGAFQFAAGSSDAALIVTLAPGAYTAQVASATGATGVALIEIYEIAD